jgi:hypothetical protein
MNVLPWNDLNPPSECQVLLAKALNLYSNYILNFDTIYSSDLRLYASDLAANKININNVCQKIGVNMVKCIIKYYEYHNTNKKNNIKYDKKIFSDLINICNSFNV